MQTKCSLREMNSSINWNRRQLRSSTTLSTCTDTCQKRRQTLLKQLRNCKKRIESCFRKKVDGGSKWTKLGVRELWWNKSMIRRAMRGSNESLIYSCSWGSKCKIWKSTIKKSAQPKTSSFSCKGKKTKMPERLLKETWACKNRSTPIYRPRSPTCTW